MAFNLQLVQPIQLECVTLPEGRFYVAPNGEKLDSVTTVLGRQPKGDGLVNWRKRVGDKEADGIMRQASDRGTIIHDTLEKYIRNQPDYLKGVASLSRARFRDIRPILDKNISLVYGLELPLYSYHLRAAGRMDMACDWQGVPSIVDYKTSNRLKTKEYITNYFIQAAAYSWMLRELYHINTQRLVILIMVEHEPPQTFVENVSDWEVPMLQLFRENRKS